MLKMYDSDQDVRARCEFKRRLGLGARFRMNLLPKDWYHLLTHSIQTAPMPRSPSRTTKPVPPHGRALKSGCWFLARSVCLVPVALLPR